MTRKALSTCNTPGCPELTRETHCEEHRKTEQNEERARYPRQTYGAEWDRISKRQLRKHPVCQCDDPDCRCEGQCTQPATEADHIVALRHFTTRRIAHRQVQSLCKPCHSRKTAYEVLHPQ